MQASTSAATSERAGPPATLARVRFVGKPLVFALSLLPFLKALGDTFGLTGDLGANPVEALQDHFGNWGLYFVLIALAVTPLRRLTGRAWLLRFRRMLGLFAFFYVLLHFLVWLLLDQGLHWAAILEDIVERPFITLGFLALLLLTAMAATSTNAMRRRLGKRWQQLHYAVYAVGVLGVWHYWWQVKQDIREPLALAAVLALLLGMRGWYRWRGRQRRQVPPGALPARR